MLKYIAASTVVGVAIIGCCFLILSGYKLNGPQRINLFVGGIHNQSLESEMKSPNPHAWFGGMFINSASPITNKEVAFDLSIKNSKSNIFAFHVTAEQLIPCNWKPGFTYAFHTSKVITGSVPENGRIGS